MSDFDTSDTGAPASTVIDTDSAPSTSGGGAPTSIPDADGKPASLRDTIATVVKEADVEAGKAIDPKAEEGREAEADKAAKAEKVRDDSGKFAAKEKPAEADAKDAPSSDDKPKEAGTGQEKTADRRSSEERRYPEPPARFHPEARQKWNNTPYSVQQAVEQMDRDHQTEVTRYREPAERYESVRQYDELARQNGRELKDSLAKVTEIEDAIQRNPIAGLNKILMEVGPRKADGQPLSLFEVAQFVVSQGPQGYQQMMARASQPQAQQQRGPAPEVAALQEQVALMQRSQVEDRVIAPFIASVGEHNWHRLQDDVAFFLESDKVNRSLSPADRLKEAYRLADRLNETASYDTPPSTRPDPEPERRADPDAGLNGSKSIRSTPGAVTPVLEPSRGGSIREILEDEARRMRRS